MGDSFELTLNSPITDEDWDKIMDVEFENTKSISFRTKSGKTVEFAKVSEEFEWCHDCKEYDAERHCCPRWTKVIRKTVEEVRQGRPKGKWVWVSSTFDRTPCEMRFRCSNCHHETITHGQEPWGKFCPNCGADMGKEPKRLES